MPRPGFERLPLASRLILFGLTAGLLIAGLGGWLLRESLHDAVLRSAEHTLHERSERLLGELRAQGLGAVRSVRMEYAEFGRIFSGWYWVLQHGARTWQSRSAWDSALEPSRARPFPGRPRLLAMVDPQGRSLLGLREAVVVDGKPMQWHVFIPMDETAQELRRIDRILLLTQLGLLLAWELATVASVRFGLEPLRRLRESLARIESGAQAHAGGGFGPDLDPVAMRLDQVLRRNAEIVERARNRAADLGHALKKPLAVLGIEARKASVPGERLQAQVRAMSDTIDRHLARYGSGAGSTETVDVEQVLERVLELMRRIHGERGIAWDCACAPGAPGAFRWRGAASDLEEMLGNVLDNAGKWARSRVTVGIRREHDGRLDILVDDDGPGMTPEQRAQAVERGRRFDERPNGHGLGLAIAQDIVETYGGRLTLSDSPLGGLRCVISI